MQRCHRCEDYSALNLKSQRGERVIFVPFLSAFGGVERLILLLSRFLYEQGLTSRILCFQLAFDLEAYADFPLTITALQPRRNPLLEAKALRDYFHSCPVSSYPPLVFDLNGAFYAGLAAMESYHLHLTDPPSLLSRDTSKYSWSVRPHLSASKKTPSLTQTARGELYHWINRRGIQRSRSVIVMSDSIAREVRNLYGVVPHVIYPGVEMGKERPPRSPIRDNDSLRMLSVGRLEATKHLDSILHAVARLRAHDPLFRNPECWILDVVGDGTERANLENLSHTLGLQNRVAFHGQVREAGLKKLYEAASFILIPANQGYGLPALEALAQRVPVILSGNSGVAEILKGTPWVETVVNLDEALDRAIATMAQRVFSGALSSIPVPRIPTRSEWARNVSDLCEWLK
jgi:glycosyltransferase involved in cell wall biosynthesis